MTCGRYIRELLIQNLVNKGLQSVSEVVFKKKEKAKTDKKSKANKGKNKKAAGEEEE